MSKFIYYVLNTNKKYRALDTVEMLSGKIAAAFCQNKTKIDKINGGDTVFLYESKKGIIAFGQATGIVHKKNRIRPEDGVEEPDGCHYQKLTNFYRLKTPLPPSEIKRILDRNVAFTLVMFKLRDGEGEKIITHLN